MLWLDPPRLVMDRDGGEEDSRLQIEDWRLPSFNLQSSICNLQCSSTPAGPVGSPLRPRRPNRHGTRRGRLEEQTRKQELLEREDSHGEWHHDPPGQVVKDDVGHAAADLLVKNAGQGD